MFNSSCVEKKFLGVSVPLGFSVKKSLHDNNNNDKVSMLPTIILIFIKYLIFRFKNSSGDRK
ncbi:unknown [Bacteroides fragilis CAG:558]|nr:unknown [Bacteroides fragilis CAG:558]